MGLTLMDILHVTQGYAPAVGGTELVIQRVSEELTRQFDDRVSVFTTNCYGGDSFHIPWMPVMPAGQELVNDVRIRRFTVDRWQGFACHALNRGLQLTGLPVSESLRVHAEGPLIPGLRAAIAGEPVDIIAASSFPLMHMFDAVAAARSSNRPCVLIGGIHVEDRRGFDRRMIDQAITDAAQYIAYTPYEAQYVISRGALPDRVHVTGAGIDPEPFLHADGKAIREEYGLGEDPVIGFIGQLSPHKGPDVLLQAMPAVWDQIPEARLILAGARRKFARKLEAIIRQFGKKQRERITLVYDFPSEMKPALFAALNVFAYPSRYESFGIAFLEAWSAGKPVIGCRAGAIPWVVSDQQDGLLVEPGNVHDLGDSLVELLRNPAVASKLAERGRRKTLSEYTWPEVARRFRNVYQRALQRV